MCFAGAGPANQNSIALLGKESAAGEITHQGFVNWRSVELEVVEILGERQLGYGELVFDRACLLLIDLGGEQIADDALRLVLAFDRGRHDLIEGGPHAVELKLTHEVEQFGSFHQLSLLRLS